MIINVLFEQDQNGTPHSCPYIRLLRPLGHPSLQGKVRLIASPQLSEEKADVVVVERWWLPGLTEADARRLVAAIRKRGSTLIYTLDDNLLDVGLDEEGFAVSDDKLRATRYFIREADGVIVSTPALADRLRCLNAQIRVVPNALDEQLFLASDGSVGNGALAVASPEQSAITLGYMGTLTHTADLAMLIEPLRRIFEKYGDQVCLEIIGISQDSAKLRALLGGNVRVLDPGDSVHYEQFARWFSMAARWDIGLAPLTDRSFNRYKSDIKFLDYGVLGIPGLFSNFGPYPASVLHESSGMLVENSPDEWFAAMSRLIDDEELRQRIGGNAREYVIAQRLLKTRARDWLDAINALHGTARSPSQLALSR